MVHSQIVSFTLIWFETLDVVKIHNKTDYFRFGHPLVSRWTLNDTDYYLCGAKEKGKEGVNGMHGAWMI